MYNPPFLQLTTWNDWGEGTCFEPTTEKVGTPASHFRQLLDLQQHLTSHQDEASFVTATCQFWQRIAYEVNHTDWPVVGLCPSGPEAPVSGAAWKSLGPDTVCRL